MNNCTTPVRGYGGIGHGHPCKFRGKVQRNGRWYCLRHDPVTQERRRDVRELAEVRKEKPSVVKRKTMFRYDLIHTMQK